VQELHAQRLAYLRQCRQIAAPPLDRAERIDRHRRTRGKAEAAVPALDAPGTHRMHARRRHKSARMIVETDHGAVFARPNDVLDSRRRKQVDAQACEQLAPGGHASA